jgi:hypothetical protein
LPVRTRIPVHEDTADGQRECTRGDWCSEPRISTGDNGAIRREPALTPRAFCETDRAYFANRLGEMPSAYGRLAAEIGRESRRGTSVRIPFGPRLPLRADVDAQMRLIAATLVMWSARVRGVAHLLPHDPARGHVRSDVVRDAAETLHANLDVLLARPPEWMVRTLPMAPGRPGRPAPKISGDIADVYGECEIVRFGAGVLSVMVQASGEDAGNEILRLHYLARRVLGETKTAPESFDGIPCRQCGDIALERAEPPSDPKHPAMHSRCASCQHEMDRGTYMGWARWYGRWADGATLVCRRCEARKCELCVYGRCACQGAKHAA